MPSAVGRLPMQQELDVGGIVLVVERRKNVSYEIVYGKQFVKLRRTKEVIPMLLAGSNNCYDLPTYGHSRGRRVRSWSNAPWYNRKGKISEKPEIIIKNLDAELNRRIRNRYDKEDKPSDIRKRFGYYASVAISGRGTRGTSWNAWRSQFTNGIKNALTIEELVKLGVHLYFQGSTWGDKPNNGIPETMSLETEAQYFAELKKWRAWKQDNGRRFWLDFRPYDTDIVLDRLRVPGREARRKARKEKTEVQQDHYFVLTDGYNGLRKYVRHGYRYSFNKKNGKRFRTEKDAEDYRQRLLKANRFKAEIWKVERVNLPATFLI